MSHIKDSCISNLTDEELLKSVHHAFPNIKGLLKQLVDRFEEIVDNFNLEYETNGEAEVDDIPPEEVECPNCGTSIPVED